MKHLLYILPIIFFSCKSQEVKPETTVVIETISQMCLSKIYYTPTDTVVYDYMCFEVDTTMMVNGKLYILSNQDSLYSASLIFPLGYDTVNVQNPGFIINNIDTGPGWSSQQCKYGKIIITEDVDNMISGHFTGSGNVSKTDTVFVLSGNFTNVKY